MVIGNKDEDVNIEKNKKGAGGGSAADPESAVLSLNRGVFALFSADLDVWGQVWARGKFKPTGSEPASGACGRVKNIYLDLFTSKVNHIHSYHIQSYNIHQNIHSSTSTVYNVYNCIYIYSG